MRQALPLMVCSLASLALGLLAGRTFAHRDRPPVATSVAKAAPSPAAAPSAAPADRAPRSVYARMETFLRTEWADTVSLINACGDLAAFTDAEVRAGWALLQKRARDRSHQERALSLYLWSRLARLEPGLAFPESWTAGMEMDALIAEQTRQSMDRIAQTLRDGQPLTDIVRRAFFTELIKRDARAALDFWFEVSNPLDEVRDLPLFSELLRDPAQREATLRRLRAWQADPRYIDELIIAMAGPWLTADLTGSEAWIRLLPATELKQRLLTQFGTAHGLGNPHETFRWSENLPVDQRLSARGMSVIQLAQNDPAAGMLLINSVADRHERESLTRTFASTLAFTDLESWVQWRDALPASERNLANSAAFPAWADFQTDQAAAWLRQQAPGKERDVLATELVRISAAKNTAIAITWINTIQDPRHRMTAISMALNNVDPNDTARMQSLLDAVARPPAAAPAL